MTTRTTQARLGSYFSADEVVIQSLPPRGALIVTLGPHDDSTAARYIPGRSLQTLFRKSPCRGYYETISLIVQMSPSLESTFL